ncbi:DUF6879 family protein [Streptomyces sp. NBC_00236]|uniref:DUF6879 family protein n=1 Tax=Streptomyces sp. NBC_00236 TaxID=2903639 RepID=UPI002E2B09B7|nr:DUF6879 family protein [Streptomyces sp. NBC_00236]
MSQTVPPFAELLANCRRSAVHLETRDTYGIPKENSDFTAWRAGRRYDNGDRSSWWSSFHDAIAEATSRGVVIRRARIVSEPLSEYVRFEHARTPRNIEAGEEVRWLPRRLAVDLLVPVNDFWLFDDERIRVHHFAATGAHVRDELEERADVVERHAEAFRAVWERAIPHEDYRV